MGDLVCCVLVYKIFSSGYTVAIRVYLTHSMQVQADNNSVLMGHGLFIYRPGKGHLFDSVDGVVNLKLYGLPNSSGQLIVSVVGEAGTLFLLAHYICLLGAAHT